MNSSALPPRRASTPVIHYPVWSPTSAQASSRPTGTTSEPRPSRPVAFTSIAVWTPTSPTRKWSAKAPLYQELKARVRAVLYAPTYDEACRLLDALTQDRARFKGIGRYDTIRTLERNFDVYTAYHHTPGLPADNNVTENIIKQLNKKLRLMEGFESLESAERYVRLLVGCYRFKRFTDSCRRADNGKAPLELADVDIAGRDWLSYLLDR
jgi:hypothetical protein